MTVSHFAALESRIPMVGAERMMDAAQAALYPHLTKEGGSKLWASWARQARPPQQQAGQGTASRFTLNGVPIGADALEQQVTAMMGLGAVA